MSFWENLETKDESIAVISIGSSSVGGMLSKREENGTIKVIAAAREPINFLLDVSFDAFWRCARQSLEKVLTKINDAEKPDKIFCIFSSPWFVSQRRLILKREKDSFYITKKLIEDIVDDEIKRLKESKKTNIASTQGETALIERHAMKITANGNPIDITERKKTTEIKVHAYISSGIKKTLNETREIIREKLGWAKISFHTLPIVTTTELKKTINAEKGFILADIGGEITDITLVEKNEIKEVASFPKGKNHVIRKISSRFKISLDEAQSLLNIYKKEHIKEKDAFAIKTILQETKEDWLGFLYDTLEKISENNKPLPSNLLLMSLDKLEQDFIKDIQSSQFTKFTNPGERFIARQIMPKSLEHLFEIAQGTKRDVFLMIETLFAANQ